MGSQKPLRARALRVWHRIGLRLYRENVRIERQRQARKAVLMAEAVAEARRRLAEGGQ